MKDVPHLVYLGFTLRDKAPLIPRALQRYIPQIEIVNAARLGLDGASDILDIPLPQLRKLYQVGEAIEDWEVPSAHSYRLAVAAAVIHTLEDKSPPLPLDEHVAVMGLVATFLKADISSMVAGASYDLSEVNEFQEIDKFNTGFEPLDVVSQGMYQALVMLMALPGTGKTSTMISIAECMKKEFPLSPLKFFQQEIPGPLFLGRMKPVVVRDPKTFKPGDMVYTAKTLQEILEIIMEDSSNDQIVFIDSPDAMSGPGAAAIDGGRRFDLENIYRSLVGVKTKTKCIFVASQPKRTEGELKMTSAAEAYAKTWYADMIIGFWGIGNGRIKMKGLKNRFGPANREATYNYDYVNLLASGTQVVDDWGDLPSNEEEEY